MPDREMIIDSFKGISRNANRSDMPEQFFWNFDNGYIDVDIATNNTTARKRGGTVNTKHISSAAPSEILTIGSWSGEWTDGTKKLFFVKSATKWYQAKAEGVTNIELVEKYTPTGTSYENDWCLIRPVANYVELVICSGIKAKRVDAGVLASTDAWTTGTSDLSSDTAMPDTSTACHIHERRIYLNNTTGRKKMIAYGSKLDDPRGDDGFSKSGEAVTLDVGKFVSDDDEIIGFRSLGKLLVIFLHNHIAVYNAPVTWEQISIQKIINVGAISNKAITNFGNDIFFMSYTGIKKLSLSDNGQASYFDLTRNIQPIYNSIIKTNNNADACAIFDPNTNLIYFSLANHSTSVANRTGYEFMVYSPFINNIVGFYKFQHATPNTPAIYDMHYDEATKTMLFGYDYLYKHSKDTYTDETGGSAANFEFKIELPAISGLSHYSNTAFKEVKTLLESTKELALTLSYKYANESAFTDLSFSMEDDIVIDSGANLYSVFDVGGRGRGCQFNISNTDDAMIDLESLYIKMTVEGKK